VKIVGTSAGLSNSHDGATHQAMDDLALMRVLPNMTVVVPCDGVETRKATRAIYEHVGPTYLRIDRMSVPSVYESPEKCEFSLGKAIVLKDGSDVTVVAIGYPVGLAFEAACQAQKEGINVAVLDTHTLKPMDSNTIIKYAKETGAIVAVEEHSVIGGLGSAMTEILGENCPVPIRRIGIRDKFGESALSWDELLDAHGITVDAIKSAIRNVLKAK
jgi:transketolase